MFTNPSNNNNNSSIKRNLLQSHHNNKPNHHSITTLNINSTTNTTVTTAASSSVSSAASTSSPTASSANQDDDIDYAKEDSSLHGANNLTVSDQSFGLHQHNATNSNSLLFSQQQSRSNLSTFSSKVASNGDTAHQTNFRSPRCFIGNAANSSQPMAKAPQSLLESSGSFTNGFSSTNDKISDSLDAKFLNKLCEEIEVSLNVDCECADDYSSNDFSGDYSFDHEMKTPSLASSSLVVTRHSLPSTSIATAKNNPYAMAKSGLVKNSNETNKKPNGNLNSTGYKSRHLNVDVASSHYDNAASSNSPSKVTAKTHLGVLV